MKTLHYSILAVFLVFAGMMLSYHNTAYGIWVRQSPQELLNDSATIFVGNITSVNVLQFEKGSTYITEENGIEKNIVKNYTLNLDEYKVNIEEFLKNTQNTNKITVRQPAISWSPGMLGGLDEFHVGDRVLFYVKNLDGNNTYSPESFIIPKSCTATNVLTQSRLVARGESFEIQNGIKVDSNFTANKPIQFVDNEDVDTLSGKILDTVVHITKNTGSSPEIVFSKEIHSKAKPCEWIASTEWEFTPHEGEYRMDVTMKEDNKTYSQHVSKFSVKPDVVTPDHMSPLKQFKSGISAKNVQCKDPLILVMSIHNTPACLNTIHLTMLYSRGWVKDILTAEKLFREIPDGIAMNFFPPIKTNATVLINENINTISLPLYSMSNSSQGIAFVQNGKFGMESRIYDNNHLLLTMYKGNSTNGTIIAATATNISSEKIMIQNFELDGSYWFPFDGSGRETQLLHTFPIGKKDSSQCNCIGNPYPTIGNPVLLEPHESVTAYVRGTFITRDLSLNKFSASVGYDFNESNKTSGFLVSSQFLGAIQK